MRHDIPFAKQAFTKADWKTKRRIMRSFKMGEISGVDEPAQEGARIVMMKRAPDPAAPALNDTPLVIAKAMFAEVFAEEKTEQVVCRAFYDAMDDRWLADSSFQEALKSGSGDEEISKEQYLAAVRQMAENAVASVRAARSGSAPDDETMKSSVAKAVGDAKPSFAKHVKEQPMFKTLAELQAAIAKYTSGDRTVSKADLRKAAIDLDAVTSLTGDLSFVPATDPAIETLKRENAELKLTPDVRKHYDGLDDAAKTTFLAKSATEQQAEVEAMTKGDPIVYTAKDGTVIRKSDGAATLMMAKNFDAINDRLDKVEKGQVEGTIEKRASTEFPNLPTKSTVAMLKAAANLEDAEANEIIEGLRVANKAVKPKFQQLGNSGYVHKSFADPEGAEDKIEALAKSLMAKSEGKLTYEQAYAKALSSPEGREIFNEMVGFEPN